MALYLRIFIVTGFVLLLTFSASAQEFTSDNFKVLDPGLFPGGLSTSTSFQLTGVVSQIAIGTSSASSYNLFGGSLYFPYVSTPIVTATGGEEQVSLSWTSADASTGWAVGGYSTGISTTNGGPYTFTAVGDVLSSTYSNLTAGTTYYFVIRVLDALDNTIATSTQTSAVPTEVEAGGGGGGGGGGGSTPSPSSASGTGVAKFSGRAYPGSFVTVLKDAQLIATTRAGVDGTFQTSVSNLSTGTYIFSVYSEDKDGRRSSLVTFPTSISTSAITDITGIFIAPTIGVDKSEVRRGDALAIFGQSAPQADVVISINSEEEFFGRTVSDKDGIYLYNFDTTLLEFGSHSAKSKAAIGNQLISGYGLAAHFRVGNTNILAAPIIGSSLRGDLNTDTRVNLVDFSIIAYWYNRSSPPVNVDLNGDGKVNLVDFSILAFNWTG